MLLLTLLAACSATPTQRWAEARIALTAAQDTIVDLYEANLISDAEMASTEPVIKPARRALEVAESKLPEGGPTFEQLLDMARAAVEELQRITARELGGASSTPQPSSPSPGS